MSSNLADQDFLAEHHAVTRRYFVRMGVVAALSAIAFPRRVSGAPFTDKLGVAADPYFTPQEHFVDVSRGKPLPHSLDEEKRAKVGLTRETWRLDVIGDPEHPPRLARPLSRAAGNALDFPALLKLGETHAVRFPKLMTCLNMGCPLGMGLWEGVPLREIINLTRPRDRYRRVFYYGYHNDEPAQMFRSSLSIDRILEDPIDLPPVIVCYKLNGEWLSPERGGPVRIVVPEAYGFKSIKWLSHVVISDLYHANDTYGEQGNDVDSPLKTYASALVVPPRLKPGEALAVSGYAQAGISGLTRVQVSVVPAAQTVDESDPTLSGLPWQDAPILPRPARWGALPGDKIPAKTSGFDDTGRPRSWPLRLTKAHWAAVLPGMPAGLYTFRCRSIDQNGKAQPMPRPYRKSGFAAIAAIGIEVKA